MKLLTQVLATLILTLPISAFAAQASINPAYKATLEDIKETLGMVPTMFKEYPEKALPGAWEEMKAVQLSANTMIPPKYKELIGLAVSSQIPCRYCVYFHKKVAALHGATPQEMNEAIAVAGGTRKWSAVIYGNQTHFENFKKDVNTMVNNVKAATTTTMPAPLSIAEIKTSDAALKDIQTLFGLTPEFLREYYKPGIVGAWKEMRDFQMSTTTQLPLKIKDLISVAVGAQIPCQYCTYADTEFAKLDGATPEEIKEAVNMAAIVRNWSTFLNGLAMEENQFKREVDQMISIAKKRMAAPKAPKQASTH